MAAQQSQATQFVTDVFHIDVNWLNQIDQPVLNVAQYWSDVAAYDQSVTGNYGQAKLANTAAEVALKLASYGEGNTQPAYMKVSVNGHETEVTVYPTNTDADLGGTATFHDIDPGIGGIAEAFGVAILNVAAAVFPETGLPYAAAAVDAAEAGKDFSQGQVIEGLLSLAAAAGGVEGAVGDTEVQQIVNTAAEGVGGVYGLVQSAQSGDPLGIVAGILEAAAASASGYGLSRLGGNPLGFPSTPTGSTPVNPFTGLLDPGLTNFSQTLSSYLGVASTAVTVSDAFARGDVASGLLSSLGPALSQIALDFSNDSSLQQKAEDDILQSALSGHESQTESYDEQVLGIPSGAEASGDNQSMIVDEAADGPNKDSFARGTSSTPFADAEMLNASRTSAILPLITANGTIIKDFRGDAFQRPDGLSPKFIYDHARVDATDLDFSAKVATFNRTEYDIQHSTFGFLGYPLATKEEAVLALTTPIGFFGTGGLAGTGRGIWDAQAYAPGGESRVNPYTPYASYLLGVYAAGSGMNEEAMLGFNNDVFHAKYYLLPAQQFYNVYTSTPAENVKWIQQGYHDAQAGLFR